MGEQARPSVADVAVAVVVVVVNQPSRGWLSWAAANRSTASPENFAYFQVVFVCLCLRLCGEVNKPSSHQQHLWRAAAACAKIDGPFKTMCVCVCVTDQFSYSLLPFVRLSACLFALSGVRRALTFYAFLCIDPTHRRTALSFSLSLYRTQCPPLLNIVRILCLCSVCIWQCLCVCVWEGECVFPLLLLNALSVVSPMNSSPFPCYSWKINLG